MIVPETYHLCHQGISMTGFDLAHLSDLTIQSHDFNGEANDLYNPSRNRERIHLCNGTAVAGEVGQSSFHRLFNRPLCFFDRIQDRRELCFHTSVDHAHAALDHAASGFNLLRRNNLDLIPRD